MEHFPDLPTKGKNGSKPSNHSQIYSIKQNNMLEQYIYLCIKYFGGTPTRDGRELKIRPKNSKSRPLRSN
eukprot:1865591-Ditylum_brightwellii.AAC.1